MAVLATLADRSTALAITVLEDAAVKFDVEWLDAALKAGLFRVPADLGAELDPRNRTTGTAKDHWGQMHRPGEAAVLPMIASVFASLKKADTHSISTDPVYGEMNQGVSVGVFPSSPGFADFYRRLVDGFVVDVQGLREARVAKRDSVPGGDSHVFKREQDFVDAYVNGTAAGLIALGCALQCSQEVGVLAHVCPGSLYEELDPILFAGAVVGTTLANCANSEAFERAATCRYVPGFFAIHYSAYDCLDALVAEGWRPLCRIGSFAEDEMPDDTDHRQDDRLTKWDPATRRGGLTVVDILGNGGCLRFAPSMLAKVLDLIKDSSGRFREIDTHRILSEACDHMHYKGSYGLLTGFLRGGAMDVDRDRGLRAAAEAGCAEVFDHYRNELPGDVLGDPDAGRSILHESVCLDSVPSPDGLERYEALALKVIDFAVADGLEKEILGVRVMEDDIETLGPAIRNGFRGVVARFVQGGVDLRAPVAGLGWSPADLIHSTDDEEMIQMVRSVVAREKTNEILNSIGALAPAVGRI